VEPRKSGIDSLVTFSNSQGQEGRGTLVHITRSQAVFEVYNPYSLVQLSEMLKEIIILRGERVIYRGKGVVTSIVNTGLMTIVSTTFTDEWRDPGALMLGNSLREEVTDFIDGWEHSHNLDPDYQLAVNKMANFFAEISRWIEEVQAAIDDNPQLSQGKGADFEDEIKKPVATKMGEFLRAFEQEAAKIPAEEVELYKSFARREIHPFMLCAPFAHRTFSKPLGYAGDYEMVNMMLGTSPDTGTATYARIFHELTVNVAACEAHRNRIDYLVQTLKEEAERVQEEEMRVCNILNIGCGPAVEVQRFIEHSELAEECVIHLVDFNSETLAYTRSKIEAAMQRGGREPKLSFIQKSVDDLLREIQEKTVDTSASYDLVYCAGLFDYFPDRVCQSLTHLFYRWVRSGGRLVVTNVTPANPDRYSMEHLLEWYLVYRDVEQMETLSPPEANGKAHMDETGVNVFLNVHRP